MILTKIPMTTVNIPMITANVISIILLYLIRYKNLFITPGFYSSEFIAYTKKTSLNPNIKEFKVQYTPTKYVERK